MFVQQLLSRGYGFDERAFGGVIFQKKVGWGLSGAGRPWGGGASRELRPRPSPQAADTAVGWALGYMLNLTNLIPADPPGLRKGTDFSSWVVLLLLFASALLAALVLLLRQVHSAKLPSTI